MLVFDGIYMTLTGFWWGNLKGSGHYFEDLGAGGRDKMKIDLKEIGREGMDWIYLAQERIKRRTPLHGNERSVFNKRG